MQMEVDDEFEMEFDSDDELGRDAEIKRKRRLSRYIVDKELPESKSHSFINFIAFLIETC